ncbi:MAG: hypothetical protein E6I64_09870 [Chloroflexi bacterium]|nr:MAG: hypothetical protein E6I64_09870 [Chloroflexota bacterium]
MVPRGRGTERRWHGVCFSGRQPGSPGAKKEDALQRRKAWRTELVARTVVGTRALAATRKAS